MTSFLTGFKISALKFRNLNVLSHDEEFASFTPTLAAHKEAYAAVLLEDE